MSTGVHVLCVCASIVVRWKKTVQVRGGQARDVYVYVYMHVCCGEINTKKHV